jgi:hypothetical protein
MQHRNMCRRRLQTDGNWHSSPACCKSCGYHSRCCRLDQAAAEGDAGRMIL